MNLELAAIHEEDCDLNLLGVLEAQEAVPSLTDENDTLQVQPDPVARSGDLFGPGTIASSVPTVPGPDAIARLLGWIDSIPNGENRAGLNGCGAAEPNYMNPNIPGVRTG